MELIVVKRTVHLASGYILLAICVFEAKNSIFLNKKKEIANEGIYTTHVGCASQWQGSWLCLETSIDMKFYNMNDVVYDRWNESLITYIM